VPLFPDDVNFLLLHPLDLLFESLELLDLEQFLVALDIGVLKILYLDAPTLDFVVEEFLELFSALLQFFKTTVCLVSFDLLLQDVAGSVKQVLRSSGDHRLRRDPCRWAGEQAPLALRLLQEQRSLLFFIVRLGRFVLLLNKDCSFYALIRVRDKRMVTLVSKSVCRTGIELIV